MDDWVDLYCNTLLQNLKLHQKNMADNQFVQLLKKADALPAFAKKKLINSVLGNKVPYVGTTGLSIDLLSKNKVVVSLENKKKARNHIGQIHAAAMALIAETASGFAVGMNLPDDKLPLIKTLKVDYKKKSQGAMVATATITDDQIAEIESTEKGNTIIAVSVTDESGEEPIQCEMTWAWVSKRK